MGFGQAVQDLNPCMYTFENATSLCLSFFTYEVGIMILNSRMALDLKHSWNSEGAQSIFISFSHPWRISIVKLLIKNHWFPLKRNRSSLTNVFICNMKSKCVFCQTFADLERAFHRTPYEIGMVKHLCTDKCEAGHAPTVHFTTLF